MTYKSVEHGYVIWQEALLLPVKKKKPTDKQRYFRKLISFEEAEKYWEYVCEDGSWNVYYVVRGVNRRMAQADIGEFSPKSIIARISDRDISVSDCRKVEREHGHPVERTQVAGLIWSKEFDGKSVFELMEQWQKMPFAHIKMVIENEGGSIDSNGIIHKGK